MFFNIFYVLKLLLKGINCSRLGVCSYKVAFLKKLFKRSLGITIRCRIYEYILECISRALYFQVSRFSIFFLYACVDVCYLLHACLVSLPAYSKKYLDSSPSLTIYCFTRFHVARFHCYLQIREHCYTNALQIVKYYFLYDSTLNG